MHGQSQHEGQLARLASRATPAYRFGDLRGLLTALAANGFRRFARLLADAATSPSDPLRALGRCYVRFARTQTALFSPMVHNNVLNGDGPDFQLLEVGLTAASPTAARRVGPSRGTIVLASASRHGSAASNRCATSLYRGDRKSRGMLVQKIDALAFYETS